MEGVVAPQASYALAFMTGILGSGHCIGMCGALVSGFFLKAGGNDAGTLPYIAYHLARISVYCMIGVLAAALGKVLVQTGSFGATQSILQITAGVVVILFGLSTLGVTSWHLHCRLLPVGLSRRWFFSAVRRGPAMGATMAGALNGFMPCSMTFAVALMATTMRSPVEGGLLMLAFGAGTLPAMLFVSVAFGRLGAQVRGTLLKLAALIVIVMGGITVYHGLVMFNVMRGLVDW